MKTLYKQFSLVLTLVILAGCGKTSAPKPASSADPILAVVRAQIDGLNRKDLPAVMAALDPASPGFEQTKAMSEKMFKLYDLRYTLKDLTLLSVNGDEAHVRFAQDTEKISGPAFRNNHIEGTHILKRVNGQWKISSTQAAKVDYLDK